MNEIDLKIINEIQTILGKLNANSEIQSIINSQKDTLTDEEVLAELIEINKSDVLFNINKN